MCIDVIIIVHACMYQITSIHFQYFKFMMESIVPANSTVFEFKQQVAKEAQKQDIDLDPAKYDHDDNYLTKLTLGKSTLCDL